MAYVRDNLSAVKAGGFDMDHFTKQPDWWIALANLTDWFDWDAIGAIGTVGAFVFAISLATRDSRDRRERSGSIIMAVMHPLSSAINVLASQWNAGLEARQAPDVIFLRILATGVFDEMRKMMEEVSIKELPTPAAIDAFIAARSALKNISTEGLHYAESHPAKLLPWVPLRVNDLIAYHEQLVTEALRFVPKQRLLAEMTRGGSSQDHKQLQRSQGRLAALPKWISGLIRWKKD